MVGGFIEDEEIGVIGKHSNELETSLLATGQAGHP